MAEDFTTEGLIQRLTFALRGVAETPDPYEDAPATNGRLACGGRVVVVPAPDGWVKIAGLGADDELLAEYSCPEGDFTDALVRRMERHVARKCGAPIRLVS